MTERWRKKLGDLDKQSPSDDVFDLAKQGPRHSDEPLPGMKTSTRIVTVVAAFLVFALAISVFVIPALRMQGPSTAAGAPAPLPLWPAQSSSVGPPSGASRRWAGSLGDRPTRGHPPLRS